jgi:hypothetical protein
MAYRRRSESSHDPELLNAALVGYEHERAVIVEKIAEIQRQLGNRAAAPSTNGAKPRRQMSPATRRRIAAAQQRRWAAFHKAQEPAKKTVTAQKGAAQTTRRMSAAARKRISEATKKRWAAYRAKKAAPKSRKAA